MAIFKDIDDFRAHAPDIHRHYEWPKLAVKINQVTRLRVIPFVGQVFYTHLEESYLPSGIGYWSISDQFVVDGGQGDATDAEKLVADYLRTAIAYFTYMHLLSTNRVQVSEMGVQQSSSSDGTSSPASYHAIQDVKDEVAEMAYQYMDLALATLEATPDDYPIWRDSDEYSLLKSVFVWSTEILNRHVTAGNSRHSFLKLRSHLEQAQRWVIRPELGDTLTDDLLAKLKSKTLSAAEAMLVERVQAWQSAEAMTAALPIMAVKVHDGNIFIRSQVDGPSRRSAADDKQIKALIAQFEEQAARGRQHTIDFLIANQEIFNYTPSEEAFLMDGDITHQLPDNSINDYGESRRSFWT